eukprot:scaffold74622_cov56-Cyclotella_meneghiniana.AAC.2
MTVTTCDPVTNKPRPSSTDDDDDPFPWCPHAIPCRMSYPQNWHINSKSVFIVCLSTNASQA